MGSHTKRSKSARAVGETLTTRLRPFQKQFLRGGLAPGIDVACLSLPRGNGKSWLAAHVLARCLTPGDDLFVSGSEYLLCSGSLEQARIVFRFIRAALEHDDDYRWIDSTTKVGCAHLPTNTRLRVMSSNAKTSFGIVGTPLVVCDEPGSWESIGGQLMFDSITTSLGKPNSPMRAIFIGTLAPSTDGWWADLVSGGTNPSTFIQKLQGDAAKWDSWAEIRRVNPLTVISPEFRKRLLTERAEARVDSRNKARFLSYRLNVPSGDEASMLLSADDWNLMLSRPTPPRSGQSIVGIDLGGGRSWSAAVAVWVTGRVEALAVAPGVPSLEDQEDRDQVSRGLYQRLHDTGLLAVAEGLRVQPVAKVWEAILEAWGYPCLVLCDRFRLNELEDVIGNMVPIEPRVTRWSEASADIRSLRKLIMDGPLVVGEDSRLLMATSLAVARVRSDDQGSFRLIKADGRNNKSRDDVAAAFTLAAGAYDRSPKPDIVEEKSEPILVGG